MCLTAQALAAIDSTLLDASLLGINLVQSAVLGWTQIWHYYIRAGFEPEFSSINPVDCGQCCRAGNVRSEEHTSELHHLGISYAVFCLKKKNAPYRRALSARRRPEPPPAGGGFRHGRSVTRSQ